MILICDTDSDAILRWQRLLYTHGLSCETACYRSAINHRDNDAQLDAVLLSDPYDPEKPPRFCYFYHPRHSGIPIVAVRQPLRQDTNDMKEADIILQADMPASKMMQCLIRALSEYHHRDYAEHRCGAARDHLLLPEATWCGLPIRLTPTERTIYRYLIDTYPRSVTAKELLRYCTKPGTTPLLCNIPSHIYRINVKANAAFGYHIVTFVDAIGYRLLQPSERSV